MKTNMKKQTDTMKEERYIFTNDEHYQIENTLFTIKSIARLLAYNADQNAAPDAEDMADVLLMAELIEEKVQAALNILDKHPEAKAA